MNARIILLLFLALVSAPNLGACAMAGTDGRIALVEMSITSVPEPERELGRGEALGRSRWEIELHEAKVVVGAMYAFGPPRFSTRLFRELIVGRAFAHAGEDNLNGRPALAEIREQIVVDALAPQPSSPRFTYAEVGPVEQVAVYLDDPRGELAGVNGPTRGHLAWVSGVARRDGMEITFEGGLDLEKTLLHRRVDSIAIRTQSGAEGYLEDGARLRVGVRAGRWLRDVDFDRHLEVADVRTPMRPSAPSQFHVAFQFGLKSADAFVAALEETP